MAIELQSKEKYSLKEYRKVKPQLDRLVNQLPKLIENTPTFDSIPGYQLINAGIEYMDNERVDPVKMYLTKTTIGNEVDHTRRLKKEFMRRGQKGIQVYLNNMVNLIKEHRKNNPQIYQSKL